MRAWACGTALEARLSGRGTHFPLPVMDRAKLCEGSMEQMQADSRVDPGAGQEKPP